MSIFAGIEIGGTKLQIIYEDDDDKIVDHFRATIDPNDNAVNLRNEIQKNIKAFSQHSRLAGIGVGFGGPIDRSKGRVFQSFQVKGWSGFSLAEWFHSWTDVPALIENDANIAAFAEATRGVAVGYQRVFYITAGSGVGSGFVINQKLYYGASPAEMEFGHLKVNMSGIEVEQKCSGWAINKEILRRIQSNPSSELAALVKADPGHESRHLSVALNNNDFLAKEILADACDVFAFAISHVIHLLSPDVVVIGGGLSLVGKPLSAEIQLQLQKYLMEIFRPGPPIFIASLGENVVPIGAIEFAKRNIQVH